MREDRRYAVAEQSVTLTGFEHRKSQRGPMIRLWVSSTLPPSDAAPIRCRSREQRYARGQAIRCSGAKCRVGWA